MDEELVAVVQAGLQSVGSRHLSRCDISRAGRHADLYSHTHTHHFINDSHIFTSFIFVYTVDLLVKVKVWTLAIAPLT